MTRLTQLNILTMATASPPGGHALTTNPTLTGGWTLIVPAGDEFLLTLPAPCQTVFVAIGTDDGSDTDTDPEPPAAGLLGHALAAGVDGMNRSLLGPGPVFARCVDSSATVILALTTWTPS